jgi:hypothetical protein
MYSGKFELRVKWGLGWMEIKFEGQKNFVEICYAVREMK